MRLERSRSPNQRIVLSQREQGWRKRIPLFTPLALAHFPEAPRIVPPAVRGRLPVEKPDKGDAGATSRSFVRKALREIQSYALRPSNETIVVSGRSSNSVRSRAASASVPARACNAYWNGCVAASNTLAHCLARTRETSLRKVSPVAMPRTPPLGLLRAVRRAKARAATTSDGTSALAKQVPAYASSSKPSASCSITCRCSARMPDRPGALPRLLVRKAAARASGVMRGKASGVNAITSLGMWSRGSGGRRSGSVSASQVASVPGASSAAVRSWRARETSPLRTRAQAACMRRSSSASPPATAREFAALPRAARNKASQSPRWKATTLSKSACLPSGPFCPTRASSMRGASTKSFQARAQAAGSPALGASWAARTWRKACTSAARSAERRKPGTSCRVATG